MPFSLPIQDHDTRLQVLDNVSLTRGDHLIKFGAEYNRTLTNQTFIGFGNGRIIFDGVQGFLSYVDSGPRWVECFNDTTGVFVRSNSNATCAGGTHIGGPVLLYLQQAGVGGRTVEQAGTQERSEEHTSELQSPDHLVCRLLLEKKKKKKKTIQIS